MPRYTLALVAALLIVALILLATTTIPWAQADFEAAAPQTDRVTLEADGSRASVTTLQEEQPTRP